MNRATAIAHLVDRKGRVHGTLPFYDRKPQHGVDHLNEAVRVSTDGKLAYTLASPEDGDFLNHIEKLFETET